MKLYAVAFLSLTILVGCDQVAQQIEEKKQAVADTIKSTSEQIVQDTVGVDLSNVLDDKEAVLETLGLPKDLNPKEVQAQLEAAALEKLGAAKEAFATMPTVESLGISAETTAEELQAKAENNVSQLVDDKKAELIEWLESN